MSFKIYQASAGSGKTYNLVIEYLSLALAEEDGKSYRKILGVTFTNKAANELKERVINFLKIARNVTTNNDLTQQLCTNLGIDRADLAKRAQNCLSDILHNYSKLSISTIDKFVHKLIRSFARELKLNKDFEIEMNTDEAYTDIANRLFAAIGLNETLGQQLTEWALAKLDEDASTSNIGEELAKFIREINGDEAILHLAKIKHLTHEDFDQLNKKIKQKIQHYEQKIVSIGEQALKKIKDNGLEIDDFSYKASGAIGLFIKASKLDKTLSESLVSARVLDAFVNGNPPYAAKTPVDIKSKIDGLLPQLIEHYQELVTHVNSQSEDYFFAKLFGKQLYLLRMALYAELALNDYREENNKVLINDFNKKIAAIVLHEPAPFIYEIIGERYQHYLIDEFQDTSILQWQNFLPLINNSLAVGGKTLIVGDGKQSIYRFRGGEVEQFLAICNKQYTSTNEILQEYESALSRNQELVNLKDNWRSSQQIVSFNNAYIDSLSELAFLQNKALAVFENGKQAAKSQNEGYVKVTLIESKKQENNDAEASDLEDSVEETYDFERANLQHTLNTITAITSLGYNFSAITILARTNDIGALICEYLLQHEIPVISTDSLLILQNSNCKLILACIELLCDNGQHKSIVDVLEQAITLKKLAGSSFELSQKYSYTDISSKKLKIKVQELFTALGIKTALSKLKLLDVYTLSETLANEMGMMNKANSFVQFFLDETLRYSSSKGNNHQQFCMWWRKNEYKLAIQMPENINAVQVMTVHKSKGLEFDNVIIPFLKWRSKSTKKMLWVAPPEDYFPFEAAAVANNATLKKTAFAAQFEEEQERDKLDEANMLYVALTRAAHNLFVISGEGKNNTKISTHFYNWIKQQADFDPEKMTLTRGVLEHHTGKQQQESASAYLIEKFISESYIDRLDPSYQAPKIWDIEHAYSEREIGNKIHSLLSKINHSGDIEKTLTEAEQQGIINQNIEKIKESVAKIVMQGEQEGWFGLALKAQNEMEIIAKSGKEAILLRPDRVVFYESSTLVIDYKTGKVDEKHQAQLNSYIEALSKMNYPQVSGKLVYI